MGRCQTVPVDLKRRPVIGEVKLVAARALERVERVMNERIMVREDGGFDQEGDEERGEMKKSTLVGKAKGREFLTVDPAFLHKKVFGPLSPRTSRT